MFVDESSIPNMVIGEPDIVIGTDKSKSKSNVNDINDKQKDSITKA